VVALEAARRIDARAYSPERHVYGCYELRKPDEGYFWDGLKRAEDPLKPYFVFQYTLSGHGVYEAAGRSDLLPPDTALLATIPSSHRYYLPESAGDWEFFWLIVRHPYVVARVIDLKRRHGAVFDLTASDAVVHRALRLLEGTSQLSFRDPLAEEQALFEFLFELERFAQHRAFPLREREQILEQVRAYVRDQIARQVDVAEIARAHGMTRSHFSHHFRALTGQAPAAFVRQIRLEEASRHLVSSGARLEDVAEETGFASANDLCKVFRRHFQITPGEYRKQMRGG
jgi:AraC-like DNA-binding protein